MTLNEIASWLHKEYGIDYRKALSIAGKMINKEGYYSKPIEETKKVAKSRAGVEDDLPVSGGDKIENPDDIFGIDTIPDDADASKTLDDWLDSMGKNYIGESGLIGYMASALSEIKNMILDEMSASDAVKKLEDAGYDDEYFNGLFDPSSEEWTYRNSSDGKIKLREWRAEVKNLCKALGIDAEDSDYYKLTEKYL